MPRNQTEEDKEGANSRAAVSLTAVNNALSKRKTKKKEKEKTVLTHDLIFVFFSTVPLITFSKSITKSKSILAGFFGA